MNADGSAKREILGSPGESTSFEDLRWSPGADRILLALRGWDGQGNNTVASEIIDLNGRVLAEFPGVSDALWSPDGGRLSAFRVNRVGGPGGYDVTAPVVIGLGTGVETTIGPDFFPQDGTVPTWSRDGNSLAWVCTSDKMTWADNVPIEPKTNCGGDGLRIAAADGSGSRVLLPMDFPGPFRPSFGNASWSPSGDTIALWASQAVSGCLGYIFVDAASGTVDRCIQLPRDSRFPDGNCGTIDGRGAGYWTADGVRFIFAGLKCEHQSGVFVHDLVLARTVMIPSRWPRDISLAANGRDLAFASDGYIWMVGLDGSSPALLAEGGVFSWKPLP